MPTKKSLKPKVRKPVNKGGAPKKDENLKISKGYKIYLTKPEEKLIEDFIKENKLQHLSKNKVLKKILDLKTANKTISVVKRTDPVYLQKLNKIGVNLNQIAKKLNSGDTFTKSVQDKLSNALKSIDKELKP